MFPLLFEIPIFGGLKIYTYGLLYALGLILGISLTAREAKRVGIRPDFIFDLSFYLILGNLAGARILYIFSDWQRYVTHPLDVLKIWEGGLVFYGGLIGAVVVGHFYCRKKKESTLKVADLYMPGLALGHAIGRIGCFASGCCYGRPMPGFPFAVTFPASAHGLAPAGTPLFPSQLAEAAALFILSALFLFLLRRKTFDGQILLIYIMFYGVLRSVLEIYRGDSIRGFVISPWLSTSQFISIGLVILAIVIYARLKRRSGHLNP